MAFVKLWLVPTLLLAASASPALGQTQDDIGNAVAITNAVLGTDGSEFRAISVGDEVYRNQVIETGEDAVAEFELEDETKLALGENTQLTLNELVYDPDDGENGKLVMTTLLGTVRFVSGTTKKENVTINTPTTTVGIRGTAFDIYVNERGETAIALIEGEVRVCNLNNVCRLISEAGYLIWVNSLGIVTQPVRWTANLLGGTSFGEAFPFITKTAVVTVPIRYAKTGAETFGAAANKTGTAVKKTTKKTTDVGKNTVKAVGKTIRKGANQVKKIFK